MWPRKKLFPWQASLGAGLQTPGHTRVVGSVPLQNPKYDADYDRPWSWINPSTPMDRIKTELKNPGVPIVEPNQSPLLSDQNNPFSVIQSDWNPSGGKYSYLENLNAKPSGGATKKKGLSMSNMIKALSEMKKPPDQAKAGAWKGGEARPQLPAPPQFAALGGVNPSIMNIGGLPDARNKKWWEIMGYGR